MNPRAPYAALPRGGFTLPEIMISIMIFAIISGAVTLAFIFMLHQVKAGCSQVLFIARARVAEQRIARHVERSKYFEIAGATRLNIFNTRNQRSTIEFRDEDGDAGSIDDNRLVFIDTDGGEEEICRFVNPLAGGEPIFSFMALSPAAVRVTFHVGDHAYSEARYKTGPGFQGTEVRFSVTPRNLQRWYD